VFICERGEMELSKYMAERLYSCFVSKAEKPEEFRFTKAGYHFGGRWFVVQEAASRCMKKSPAQ
jgi:hypothetical protein